MRFAELQEVRSQMSAEAFLESSFREELENTELALELFDPVEVRALVEFWKQRIARGEHRVVAFDGVQRSA
jgi:hypothetical protein